MTEAKPGGEPGDEPVLGAQESDAIHGRDITTPDITTQAELITPCHDAVRHTRNVEIGQRIKDARVRLGLTQTDLARLLKVRQSAISQWESAARLPDIDNRIRLSSHLRIPLNELMPEVSAIPVGALDDPQVRRLIDNFAALGARERDAIDLLAEKFREALERKN